MVFINKRGDRVMRDVYPYHRPSHESAHPLAVTLIAVQQCGGQGVVNVPSVGISKV